MQFVIFGGFRENVEPLNIGIMTPDSEKKIFSETYILHNDNSEK